MKTIKKSIMKIWVLDIFIFGFTIFLIIINPKNLCFIDNFFSFIQIVLPSFFFVAFEQCLDTEEGKFLSKGLDIGGFLIIIGGLIIYLL